MEESDSSRKIALIESIKSPIGLLAFAMITIEGVLIAVIARAPGSSMNILIAGMLLVLLTIVMFAMYVYYKQMIKQMTSDPDPPDEQIPKDSSSDAAETGIKAVAASERAHDISNSVQPLEMKIKKLQEKLQIGKDLPYVLLGSTYLDINLRPITTQKLDSSEWINMDKISVNLGGSATFIGRGLFDDYGKQSYLFTPISSDDDMFSTELRRLLAEEKWILQDGIVKRSDQQAGVTVLLVQSNQSFVTMFTSPGILKSFTWSDVENKLHEVLAQGGVLNISGYFKTNLISELSHNLNELHEDTIICLDHGRLNPDTDPPASVKLLYDAFGEAIVDIYICTIKEIQDFMHYAKGMDFTEDESNLQIIERIAEDKNLPPVTYIRSNKGRCAEAYAIVSGEVEEIKPSGMFFRLPGTAVEPLNPFNAAVLYYILHDPFDDIGAHIKSVGCKAFKSCYSKRKPKP